MEARMRRYRPDAMEVIGEDDDGIDTERRWVCTERKAARKASMCAVSKRRRRSSNATVKKYEPPGTCTRR
jgi:hypothetical protein